jgi:hypothetical protein
VPCGYASLALLQRNGLVSGGFPLYTAAREQAVIVNAVTYTVFVPKVGAWRCDPLAGAEEIASEHEWALVYDVTAAGRSTLIKDALINPTIERRLAFVRGVFLFSPFAKGARPVPVPWKAGGRQQ